MPIFLLIMIGAGLYVVYMTACLTYFVIREIHRWLTGWKPPPETMTMHELVVAQAKKGRLTAEERERRFRTIYPRGWVPRARWPVSSDS